MSDFIKQNIYIFTTFYKLNVSLRIVSHNSHMHVVLPDPRKNTMTHSTILKGLLKKLSYILTWNGLGEGVRIVFGKN